jgi:hypothetical protein
MEPMRYPKGMSTPIEKPNAEKFSMGREKDAT